jgi:magnesium-transporting ATPase (P-type)
MTTEYLDLDTAKPSDVEQNLDLLGVSGVEDILQDQVKECI